MEDLEMFAVSMPRRITAALVGLLLAVGVSACDSGELLDLAFNNPDRKPIDTSIVGVNSFFVNPGFGSTADQFADIRGNLKLRFVRVLFAWTDSVQPTPDSSPELSFYDSIIRQVPPGVEVLIVLDSVPSWMTNPNNWTSAGDPRRTFVDRWVRPVVQRYASNGSVVGFEIYNEPDVITEPNEEVLGLLDPANYVQMLAAAAEVVRRNAPGKLVVAAATESIQQDFPNHLNYNKKMKEFGAEDFTDIWNVHYYGTRFESVVTNNGVADFLNSVTKPIWVTESGEVGPNNQLAYVERAWPFLREKVPGIVRFYYYEYSSTAPLTANFGLRTSDPAFPVSDLYIHLTQR